MPGVALGEKMIEHFQYTRSRWVRWTHWVNFPILFLMIWSGILIYWANPVYRPHIPESWYEALSWDHRLAEGMGVHFTLMWIFAINGALFVGYLIWTGRWRDRFPWPRHWPEAWHVTLHELGLRKEMPPAETFNAAQRIAYTAADLLGVLALLTGLAIYKPIQLHGLTALLGGYETARHLHFWIMQAFVAFFLVHVLQVARAGWRCFLLMVTGWEREE
jgi:thiosulfate reductase cytochrome b subunit